MKPHRTQTGFTLVEIAIVLVIVGLLLGAVLKGQELIFNSKVKATYNMSREFSAAVNGYHDRYKAMPGDDGQAATRFPTYAPLPTNGNNSGLIDWGAWPCVVASTAENCQSFLHLRAAGFVSGTGATAAQTPFGGGTSIAGSSIFFPNTGTNPTLGLAAVGVTHKAALAIDTAFDDGNPGTGTFRCRNLAAYNLNAIETTVPDWCSIQM